MCGERLRHIGLLRHQSALRVFAALLLLMKRRRARMTRAPPQPQQTGLNEARIVLPKIPGPLRPEADVCAETQSLFDQLVSAKE